MAISQELKPLAALYPLPPNISLRQIQYKGVQMPLLLRAEIESKARERSLIKRIFYGVSFGVSLKKA